MRKIFCALVLFSSILLPDLHAYQSRYYEVAPPSSSWKEMENFVGTDVSMINTMTPGRVHSFSVATIRSPNAFGREKDFLDEQAKELASQSGRTNFEIIKRGKIKGAPANNYIEFTYTHNGVKKKEIYVMFSGKEQQHFLFYADKAEYYPLYFEEFLTTARSFALR